MTRLRVNTTYTRWQDRGLSLSQGVILAHTTHTTHTTHSNILVAPNGPPLGIDDRKRNDYTTHAMPKSRPLNIRHSIYCSRFGIPQKNCISDRPIPRDQAQVPSLGMIGRTTRSISCLEPAKSRENGIRNVHLPQPICPTPSLAIEEIQAAKTYETLRQSMIA